MSRLGMDADAVEAAGRELGGLATQVQRTVQDIDRLVTSLPAVWLGPSVTRYVHQWEGGMRWQTLGAADSVARLGKTALANAAAQRQVSGILHDSAGAGPWPTGPGGTGGSNGGGNQPSGNLGSFWPGLFQGVQGGSQWYGLAEFGLLAPTYLGMGMQFGQFAKNLNRLGGLSAIDGLADLKSVFRIDGRNVLGAAGKVLGDPERWNELPGALSRLRSDSAIAKMFGWAEEGGTAAKVFGTSGELLSKAGKVMGPLGVALGGYTVYQDISEGNTGRAVYDGAVTALSLAALTTPPPVDIACGVVAGGMAVGLLVYDHWDDITGFAADAGETVSHAVGNLVEGAGNIVESVGENLNPMNWFD